MELAGFSVCMSDREFEVEVGFWLCWVHFSVPKIEGEIGL